MLSTTHNRRQNATRVSEQDWQRFKDFIYVEYLFKGEKAKDIIEALKMRGLDVTKPQLEYKIKQWGFIKNISANMWRNANSVIQKRQQAGKMSVVIRSGKRLPLHKVETEIRRNVLPSLISREYMTSSGWL
ncbi:hypothetical protein GQ53DRAFT_843167 [Thozetella sp. PMI_491]|nr:hypothetical protein GQ53DRAFT_843167 [Thozetella sp. PMI_491]